jgi:predicted oxidoreductase
VRVREAAAGSEIELTRPEWYRLLVAGGGLVP